jgi:hypothetical protein
MDTISSQRGAPRGQERRRYPRYHCQGSAEIIAGLSGAHQWGTFTDLSQGGCYVETPAPLVPGQEVQLKLTVVGLTFSVTGRVAVSHPMFGMGVIFTLVDPDSTEIMLQALQHLADSVPESARLGPQPLGPSPVPAPSATAAPRPMRLSPQTAVSLLGQIARHLAQRGVLTQQDFLSLLEKNTNS